MIALKMIDLLEASTARGAKPVAWHIRNKVLAALKRESRHTGDLKSKEGHLTFLTVPIEVADVRNSLGAVLLTNMDATSVSPGVAGAPTQRV